MSLRLAGSARVAIAAVSIGLVAAACGSADEPGADRSDPATVVDTSAPGEDAAAAPTAPAVTAIAEPAVSEAEVTELEQQLDEIDRVLADLEAQLSED